MTRIHQIICTNCKTTLNSKAGVPLGQELACPKCKAKFKVTEPDKAEVVDDDFQVIDGDEEEAPSPTKKATPAVAKETPKPKTHVKKPAPEEDGDEEEENPRAKKHSSVPDDDEEEVKPRAKRKPVDDEEEDEKPRVKRKAVDDDVEEEKPKTKRKARGEDEDDEVKPKSKRRGRDENDDEDDERPRKKKRRRDEDDEDDEPGTFGKLKKNIWVRLSVLVVLLGTAGFLGWKLYQKRSANADIDDEIAKHDAEMRKGAVRPEDDAARVQQARDLRTKLIGTWESKTVDKSTLKVRFVVTYEQNYTYSVSGPMTDINWSGKWALTAVWEPKLSCSVELRHVSQGNRGSDQFDIEFRSESVILMRDRLGKVFELTRSK